MGIPTGLSAMSDADRKMTAIAGAMASDSYSMGFAATYAVGRIATWGWLQVQAFPGIGAVQSLPAQLRNQTLWLTGDYGGQGR